MNVDYIVVGLGIAGISVVHELKKRNKSFVVFEDSSQNSSSVAGGMYNPVVLKRFTPAWQAHEQMQIALPFYKEMESVFNRKYDYKIPIYRVFKSIEEQNNWFTASDNSVLEEYMIPKIETKKFNGIKSPCGFGILKNTGRIETGLLLNNFKQELIDKGFIYEKSFDYNLLTINKENVSYQSITAKNVVFCEGYGMVKNPFFNYLPLQEAKGELLIIYAPDFSIDFLIKSAVFVMPLGNNYYKVGATFNWKDKTATPTEEGKLELIEKLNSVITCSYKIVNHIAGIRPTVRDRRPLIGVHPKYTNLAICNGLGTRGVLIGPVAAKMLISHLESKSVINSEYNISRFE